jgi:hypothetical protein
VFGCPCISKKRTISVDDKPEDNSQGTQRGIRGIHLGFSPTQKGLPVYVPSTRQIVISGDVIHDDTFASTVAETWRPFHDALALRPTASFIPDSYTVLERTGDLLSQFEEGNATANNNQTAATSPFEEDIIHSDLISDPVEDSSEEEATEGLGESNEEAAWDDFKHLVWGLPSKQCQSAVLTKVLSHDITRLTRHTSAYIENDAKGC